LYDLNINVVFFLLLVDVFVLSFGCLLYRFKYLRLLWKKCLQKYIIKLGEVTCL